MPDKTALGTRMKENYEQRTRYKLMRRCPVIIRLDGKAFHTYTRGLDKPFDEGLIEDMMETTRFLCEQIMGVKCGYTQSDEISLLITDFDKLETEAWFDYNLQKMCSIAASIATAKFNQLRMERSCHDGGGETQFPCISQGAVGGFPLAYFDARVFQIPEKEEVVNYFIWRQRDAEKNSVAMLAQSLYSHNELYKKNGSDMQEMCFQKGQNWNDLHFSKKRGSFVIKNTYVDGNLYDGDQVIWVNDKDTKYAIWNEDKGEYIDVPEAVIRNRWEANWCPIFSKDRESILKLF
ncbi:MAG: tRNA(His) guanylyltransferase Thg1 family protein [Sphaerochaetaceae bacterium]|nr:tRNA(His) guanylyltransferase Thg1 family protein [Sphaerochaetaceae bacterium]